MRIFGSLLTLGLLATVAAAGAIQISYALDGGPIVVCGVSPANTTTSCVDTSLPLNITGLTSTSNSPGLPSGAVLTTKLSVANLTSVAHVLDLFIAAQDFTIPVTAPPVNFTSQIGATVITGSSLNSLSFTSCLDQANELGPPSGTFCGVPAGSIMLSPSITTAGPFFNTQTTISVAALAAPYAVDQRLTLILGAGASVDLSTTLISAVTPVPEPASGTLLGGIAILLVVGRLIPRSIPRSLRS
jgi:hypothetical protein